MSDPAPQMLTAADDGFHPPASPADTYWTETSYFAFDLEERALSLAIYPLFRPNLGICSLALHLWDASGVLPWEIPYSKFQWHIPLAEQDLTDLTIAGLTYQVIEPLQKYFVGYDDPGRLTMELEFNGLDQPWSNWTQVDTTSRAPGKGHFDQDCRVTGTVTLNGERIAIDTFGHRDRSWYSRPDAGNRRSASVSQGISAREQFLILRPRMLDVDGALVSETNGYLVRDGVRAPIRSAERRVTERKATMPMRFELEATDALGRRLEAVGCTNSTLAFNTSPPVFAWMSQVSWATPGGALIGEDQETYAFAEIGPLLRAAAKAAG